MIYYLKLRTGGHGSLMSLFKSWNNREAMNPDNFPRITGLILELESGLVLFSHQPSKRKKKKKASWSKGRTTSLVIQKCTFKKESVIFFFLNRYLWNKHYYLKPVNKYYWLVHRKTLHLPRSSLVLPNKTFLWCSCSVQYGGY